MLARRGVFQFEELPAAILQTEAPPAEVVTEFGLGYPYKDPNKIHPYVLKLVERSAGKPLAWDGPQGLRAYRAIFLDPKRLLQDLPHYETHEEFVRNTRNTIQEFFKRYHQGPIQVAQITEELRRARPQQRAWRLLCSIRQQHNDMEVPEPPFEPEFIYAWVWLAGSECLRWMKRYYAWESACTVAVERKRRLKARMNGAARILVPMLSPKVAETVQADLQWLRTSLDCTALSPETIRAVRRHGGIQRQAKTHSSKHSFWNPIIKGLVNDLGRSLPHRDLGSAVRPTPEKAYTVTARLLSLLWPGVWRWQVTLPALIKTRYYSTL